MIHHTGILPQSTPPPYDYITLPVFILRLRNTPYQFSFSLPQKAGKQQPDIRCKAHRQKLVNLYA